MSDTLLSPASVTPPSAGPGAGASEASVSEIPAAERERLDVVIDRARAASTRWAALSLADRAALLRDVHQATSRAAQTWAQTACELKGVPFTSAYAGEEWMSGPYAMLAGTGTLAHSIDALASGRSPLAGANFEEAPGDRTAVKILPRTPIEWTLLNGFSGEVWLRPGVTPAEAVARAGLAQRDPQAVGGVGLVLGAGNITSIAPLDALSELFAHNRTVVLKLNPITERMMQPLTIALWPLILEGYVQLVQGGASEGEYLVSHAGIDHIHITGSAATHDAIVWGTGDEAARRRQADSPRVTTPISSELGGVAPVIIVPGQWSSADLRFQAEHVATMRLHNGGHNCIAGQVVIVSADWPQREEFLAHLREALRTAPRRTPWYPGSTTRLQAAASAYPQSDPIAIERGESNGCLVDLTTAGDPSILETTEYFAPIMGAVSVPGTGAEFLKAAIAHANDKLAGTLGANVLIDPTTRKKLGARFRELIAELRYGTIAINTWTAFGFLSPAAMWGAYPGSTIADVGSGIGTVHNALLIDDVERTIVTGPFRPFPRSIAGGEMSLFPKPPWFVTARSAAATGKQLAGFAAKPGWLRLPGVFAAAFRA